MTQRIFSREKENIFFTPLRQTDRLTGRQASRKANRQTGSKRY
jgi:hypothetical protein